MLTQQTLEKLYTMKLNGMADAFRQQQEDTDIASLSFEERFGLLVDQQWIWQENRALARRLANAKFKLSAAVEDIDFRHARGLDRKLLRSLTNESSWVRQHQNIFLLGPTGIGKSYLACALAHKACRDGFTALYTRAPQLFRDLAVARADGSLPRRLLRLARIDVLIVDDWVMAPLSDVERRDFFGDLRRPLSEALDHSDQPVAGGQVACPDRGPHLGRQHSRPSGAQRPSHRATGRIDAQEAGP